MRIHTIIIPLLAAGALAVSACGEDKATGSGSSQSKARDAALKYAQCMREHGVNMPDPGTGGRQVFRVGPGEDTTPEEFEEAQQACKKYQEDIEPQEMSEEEQEELRQAALENSRCMREHGIENFPDPTFDESGSVELQIDKGSGINPESSEFKDAEKACESKLPEGPSETTVGENP
jgi:hypothetical protein